MYSNMPGNKQKILVYKYEVILSVPILLWHVLSDEYIQTLCNFCYCWVFAPGSLSVQTMQTIDKTHHIGTIYQPSFIIRTTQGDTCSCRVCCIYTKTSLLRRLQAQTLPDEAPPAGKIHPFSCNLWTNTAILMPFMI